MSLCVMPKKSIPISPVCLLSYSRTRLVLLVRALDQGIQAGKGLVDLVLVVVLGSL